VRVRGIRWVGTATAHYDEMSRFCREVLGLVVRFEEETTTEFATSEGDAIQVMGPGDAYFTFFGRHAAGPVPLFEVDDLDEARRDLEAAGVDVVGGPGADSAWEWLHVRAPDGHLYEIGARRRI
jgi:catechol 2,3-dioxygenase-like lactoylglutathione lyase family enzyme